MTTTELIALLKANEHGGATGRAREVSFYINNKHYIPEPIITVSGTGDGMFTTIELNLETDADVRVVEHGNWIWDGNKEECICSECVKGNLKYSTAFCPDCGADMRGEKNE